MKKILYVFLVGSITIPSVTVASDYGIGVSIKSSDVSVYIPIRLNESLFLEPYIRLFSYDDSSSGVVVLNRESSSDTYDVGLGVFRLLDSTNGLSPYYGARIGYLNRESNYESRSSSGTWGSETKSRGFNFSPTIGVKYSLYENISVDFEAEWYYTKLDNDGVEKSSGLTPSNEITEGTQTSSGTNTRIIVRYFF